MVLLFFIILQPKKDEALSQELSCKVYNTRM